jgi:hypothetical protein
VLLPLVAEARSDLTTVVRAEAARSTRNVAVGNRTVSVVENPRMRLTSPPRSCSAPSTRSLCPCYAALQPRACAPYRARTKGKTEAGVKYVKRNAVAGLTFPSFAALEAHLAAWMPLADERIHGTTHETPRARFERDERGALRPLPARAFPRREQRLRRRVANDAFIDLDTVRYSVPHRLVRDHVEVTVDEQTVRIFHGPTLVATHARAVEPYARVVDPAHYTGLWRAAESPAVVSPPALALLGRDLGDYAAVISGGER